MNRKFATLILAFSAALGVTPLQAAEKAVADVPFAFHLGTKEMPAGKYTIDNPVAGDASLFSISDVRGHCRYVGAPRQKGANPEDPKLTFVLMNGEYSLAKIQTPGSNVEYSLRLPNEKHNVGMASLVAVRLGR